LYTFAPTVNGIPLIAFAVEVNPFGPVQLHVPPSGHGARYTSAPYATVTAFTGCQDPLFTEMYGVIGAAAQVAAALALTAGDTVGDVAAAAGSAEEPRARANIRSFRGEGIGSLSFLEQSNQAGRAAP
jgi:hypothetical protein